MIVVSMSSRREFLLGGIAAPALAQKKPAASPPNLVLILADELGSWMLGCYGNREIRTPNLDRLAQTGARFAAGFVCAPAAAAGRASFLTGQAPRQPGGDGPPAPSGEVMLSDILAQAGYNCGYAGNWDLGGGGQANHFSFWETSAGAPPDAVTGHACRFVEQQGAKPFFLAVAHTTPSGAPGPKFEALYEQVKFDSVGYEPAAPTAARNQDKLRNTLASIRRAAAAVTALDSQVPPLLECLRQRGVLDNTVIVFTSVCGALLGRHGLWGGGLASNPANLYDETIAVPMIWSWPARIPPASLRPELVSSYDFLPTVCDLMDAPLPNRNLCGRSYLLPAMSRPLPKKQPWRSLVFARLGETGMARDNRFKLVLRNNGTGPNELYDIAADPREKVNQYDNPRFVSVRDRLAPELAAWQKKYSS
jgi:arylsulfatase A-like enzyme